MARQVDYYFATYSPWSFLGQKLFNDIAVKHKLKVVYKPTPLGDLFSETGGLPLAKRHPARQAYRWMDLQRWREKRGVALNLKPKYWPFQSTLADRCIIALNQIHHDPNTFTMLAFKAVWEKDLNLADEIMVSTLLTASGLNAADIIARANSTETEATYQQNRLDAMAAGVFGAPSYVIEGEVFWGQDRLELLDDMLTSGRAAYSAV